MSNIIKKMSNIIKNKNQDFKPGDLIRDVKESIFEVKGYGIFIKYVKDRTLNYDDCCIVCWCKGGLEETYDELLRKED